MAETATINAQTTIRSFRPLDHRACRDLWAELTDDDRRRYDAPREGDPGAGFEHFMARLELSGMWVAEHAEAGVIGFVGLILSGRRGEVDPIVVASPYRGAGVGRALLARVASEAKRRRLRELSISPSTRNLDAIRSFHAAGYDVLAHLTLTLDLTDTREWREGIDLHGLQFRY